jgi:transcriptional regulator with XRE-family HTH domain
MKEIIKVYYQCDAEDKKKFRMWMIEKNTKLETIAKQLKTSASYISQIFNGKKNITKKTIEKFKKIGYDIKQGKEI